MFSSVGSVSGEHKGQDKSWDSVLILPAESHGLTNEAGDTLEVIISIHQYFFKYILNYIYLVAFPSWGCWLYGYMLSFLLKESGKTSLGLDTIWRYKL